MDEHSKERVDSTPRRLNELRQERDQLQHELARLDLEIDKLGAIGQVEIPTDASAGLVTKPETPKEKVELFLNLFGTRRSVYPKYWANNKTGKKGYSPACDNEWRPGICQKPRVKCSECPHQRFPALDAQAIEAHLRGQHTLGVYAISEDNACVFLAADFDGEGWEDNIKAYRDAASRAGVTTAIERSRSGNGGHAWIFFSEPVPAALARQLGTIFLARASALRPMMSLSAYDRLFPNQDIVPVGGFGNLIALPLAKAPRQDGNTVFLREDFRPFDDQWAYMSALPRVSGVQLRQLLAKMTPLAALNESAPTGTPKSALTCDEATLDLSRPAIRPEMLSGEVTLRLDSKLHVPRALPTPILAALRRLASMPNPVFHEKLRLRFPIFDTPRFIFAGEWHADRLVLPRACLEACIRILEDAGASVVVQDQRDTGAKVAWKFVGDLRPEQETAVKAMRAHDYGVLCAPPGGGKTVMGCALIAQHRASALVLVHRSVLLDQWRETAMRFLGLRKKEIGVWRGAKPRLTHRLDLAMMPTLSRVEDLAAVFAGYGVVLIDECHHIPAATFELLLKACPARKIIGLTATPMRKDRMEKLLYLQCGSIRHTVTSIDEAASDRVVFVRRTTIALPPGTDAQSGIHEVWDALIADTSRLSVIISDIAGCIGERRSPLILADRKSYLDNIAAAMAVHPGLTTVSCYRLQGDLGKREQRAIRERLNLHYIGKTPFVLLATASFIGEGFDLPQLDTLILAMPLSFKGRLIQYVGRIGRTHEGKSALRVFDYLDENNPMTQAMFRRRSAGYRQIGYRMEMGNSRLDNDFNMELHDL